MPFVLTTATAVTCLKQGKVTALSTAKLRVGGTPVLVTSSMAAALVACPATTKPCTKVTAVGTGPATKLRVGGEPVLLDTLAGTTDGEDAQLAPIVSAGQTKLRAK